MQPEQLSGEAEEIRNEIKNMIPETAKTPIQPPGNQATLLHKDGNGNKMYGGSLVDQKISRLKEEMGIEASWEWRLVYWSKPTKILNDRKQGYLIPLTDEVHLTPGGRLQGGSYIHITSELVSSSGAAAIFIVSQ